jgi:hypothetical protein
MLTTSFVSDGFTARRSSLVSNSCHLRGDLQRLGKWVERRRVRYYCTRDGGTEEFREAE